MSASLGNNDKSELTDGDPNTALWATGDGGSRKDISPSAEKGTGNAHPLKKPAAHISLLQKATPV